MAKFEFKLPDIGEGVTEGEIVGWLAQVGDHLDENQDMVEVMTDKATVTIGAPKAGRVVELRGAVGESVPVGSVIVVLDVGGAQVGVADVDSPTRAGAPRAPSAAMASLDTGPVASAVGDLRSELPGMNLVKAAQAEAEDTNGYQSEQPLAAPATRRLARELGVDLRKIEPSGKGGRVTREDVEAANARGSGATRPSPVPARSMAASESASEPASGRGVVAEPLPKAVAVPRQKSDERRPIRGIRKRTAEHMARSKRMAAHFTYVDECDASSLIAMRGQLAKRAEALGVKLTFLPFIVKAVVQALRVHPALNAVVDDANQEIVLRARCDIGIAMSSDAGLFVPVLRDAERLSLVEIAREIQRLGQVARSGKFAPEELGGSSFTITSLGRLGGLFATPVINYPEVAILGVHEIKRRPVVRGDQIVIGDEMLLSLSFDHRIIDGHIGAAFAQEIIELLEEPGRLLLEA